MNRQKETKVVTYKVAAQIGYIDQRNVVPGAIVGELERLGVVRDIADGEGLRRGKCNLCGVLLELDCVVVAKSFESFLEILDSLLVTLGTMDLHAND